MGTVGSLKGWQSGSEVAGLHYGSAEKLSECMGAGGVQAAGRPQDGDSMAVHGAADSIHGTAGRAGNKWTAIWAWGQCRVVLLCSWMLIDSPARRCAHRCSLTTS